MRSWHESFIVFMRDIDYNSHVVLMQSLWQNSFIQLPVTDNIGAISEVPAGLDSWALYIVFGIDMVTSMLSSVFFNCPSPAAWMPSTSFGNDMVTRLRNAVPHRMVRHLSPQEGGGDAKMRAGGPSALPQTWYYIFCKTLVAPRGR